MGRFRSRARLYRRSLADGKHRETNSDWVTRAIEEGEAIIADQGVDAVWTTSGPASSVAIGHHFKRVHRLPSIADIRDSFKGKFFRPGRDVSIKRRMLYRRTLFAVRPLDLADARVYVSEGEARSDDGLFASTSYVIESGFDMQAWQRLHAQPLPVRTSACRSCTRGGCTRRIRATTRSSRACARSAIAGPPVGRSMCCTSGRVRIASSRGRADGVAESSPSAGS